MPSLSWCSSIPTFGCGSGVRLLAWPMRPSEQSCGRLACGPCSITYSMATCIGIYPTNGCANPTPPHMQRPFPFEPQLCRCHLCGEPPPLLLLLLPPLPLPPPLPLLLVQTAAAAAAATAACRMVTWPGLAAARSHTLDA